MPEYYNVTTNLGDAELANAIATNTKLDITHVAFGDGNGSVPTPNKARTSLVREVHRQAVTKYERHATNANWIVIETIIPSDIGGFTIREMGVIANGKLISHGSHAPFEKVANPSGMSEYRLRFTQNVTDGSVIEITLDGSLIYASQAWVEENFIQRSEIEDNLTTNDATKPLSAKQGKDLQDNKLGKTENASSASKLQTARTISFSGAATGSFNFDGSGNSSAVLTLANSGVTASTYGANNKIPVLTVNAKGLITGISEKTIPEVVDATTTVKGVVQLNDTLTSTSTVQALTAAQGKVLNDQAFGIGQTEKNVTGLRSLNTVYTNPTDKTITISLSGGSGVGCNLYINNKLFAEFTGSFSQTGAYAYVGNVTWLIPPHAEYELKANGSKPTIWSEIS